MHVHIIPRFDDDSPDGKWPVRRVASHHESFRSCTKDKTPAEPISCSQPDLEF